MKVMLLAAGLGTRLRPLTNTLPKPMLPVLNRPLIGWIVEHAIAAGVRDFIVNLHYLPDAIESYLPAAFPDAAFTFSYEPEILGTGGALRKVRALLEAEDDFFLANGDTIQRPPLAALRSALREDDSLAALTLRHPPAGDKYTAVYWKATTPLPPPAGSDVGSDTVANAQRGAITGFGSGTGESLMFSGSHCISRRALDLLPDRPVSGIVEDVYRRTTERLAGVVIDDPFWFDIGTPRRYLDATQAMLDGRCEIAPTARVRGAATRSVIGARSAVDGTLTGTVVWDDCRIAAGVRLDRCIVAHGVELARGDFANTVISKGDGDLLFTSF
jgi:NDP-sugar pyrophosphorylase family protein